MTPTSSDLRRPLISIIEQICAIYGWKTPLINDNIKEILENLFRQIPSDENLILLLDSIDQLQINEIKNLSNYLPIIDFPSNVKMILSTIPKIEVERINYEIDREIRSIYNAKNLIEIEVKSLDCDLAVRVLNAWLKEDRRRLTETQFQWLKPKLSRPNGISALFLSLLYDQTLKWHSYDMEIDKKFLSITRTNEAIGYFYDQLGVKHGHLLVQRAMIYLQLSGGLTETEMEDILSSDDELLRSVFQHYLPPFKLFRLPSTLWIQIRNEMQKYLIEKDIDQSTCIFL